MFFAVLLLPGLTWEGPRAKAGAVISSDSIFKALLNDGETVSGRLVSLGPGAIKLVSPDGAGHELAVNRLIKLTRDVPMAEPAPTPRT